MHPKQRGPQCSLLFLLSSHTDSEVDSGDRVGVRKGRSGWSPPSKMGGRLRCSVSLHMFTFTIFSPWGAQLLIHQSGTQSCQESKFGKCSKSNSYLVLKHGSRISQCPTDLTEEVLKGRRRRRKFLSPISPQVTHILYECTWRLLFIRREK